MSDTKCETKNNFINNKVLLLIGALITITIVFWSLNKGMLFSDEAYYLYHLKQPLDAIGYSKWYVFSQSFFQYDTIFSNRLIVVSLMIMSNLFLAKSIEVFFANRSFLIYFLILLFAQFATTSPVGYSPSYLTFNQILCSIAVGLFLIHIKNKEFYIRVILGLVFGIMMFNIPTSIGLFLPMLIFDYFTHNKIKSSINLILYVVLGMLIWIGLYFTTIEDFSLFKVNLLESINIIANDDKHNNGQKYSQ